MLAEYAAFPAEWFARAPASLDDAQASTLPCAGLTAGLRWWREATCMRARRCSSKAPAASRSSPCRSPRLTEPAPFVASGSRQKLERAKTLGADDGIARSTVDWVEALDRLTVDAVADHVLELVGGAHLSKALQAAAPGGHVHQIEVLKGIDASFSAPASMFKQVTIHGISVGRQWSLEDLALAEDRTAVKPVIDRRYGLFDLPAALDHLDAEPFGKIVIEVSADGS